MMLIPLFVIGLLLGLLLIAGNITAYAYYRNAKVPEEARWTFSLESFTKRVEERQHERARRQRAWPCSTATNAT